MVKPEGEKNMPKFPEKNGCGVLIQGKENSLNLTELNDVRDETVEEIGTKSYKAMMYKELEFYFNR